MSPLVKLTLHNDVAVITLANPPVNALTEEVHLGIQAAIRRAGVDPHVRAVILMGAGTNFCGGVDLREIQQIMAGELSEQGIPCFVADIKGLAELTKWRRTWQAGRSGFRRSRSSTRARRAASTAGHWN